MKSENPRSVTLLSLIAVILSAGVFKEEMKTIFLWEGSWNLLAVFVALALFYGFLFALYFLMESSKETALFRRIKWSSWIKPSLDFLFLTSILLILAFSSIAIILHLLVIPVALGVFVWVFFLGPPLVFIYRQFLGLVNDLRELKNDTRLNRRE